MLPNVEAGNCGTVSGKRGRRHHVPDAVRELLVERAQLQGLTHSEIGTRAGMDPSSVYRILVGQTRSTPQLLDLAKAIGVSEAEIAWASGPWHVADPAIRRAVDQLLDTGLFGAGRREVLANLLRERIRQLVVDGWLPMHTEETDDDRR